METGTFSTNRGRWLRAGLFCSLMTLTMAYDPCLYADGHSEGGGCWWLSEPSESCTQTCGSLGLVFDDLTLSYVGSDAQVDTTPGTANERCRSILSSLDTLVTPSSKILNDLGVACFQSSFLGRYEDGAGCWASLQFGSVDALRCAAMDTTADFATSSNSTVKAWRACACQADTQIEMRTPPAGYNAWAELDGLGYAASCYFDQNAVWFFDYRSYCFCPNDYTVYWEAWNTTDPLYGGTLCEELPLDPSYGPLPTTAPTGQWPTSIMPTETRTASPTAMETNTETVAYTHASTYYAVCSTYQLDELSAAVVELEMVLTGSVTFEWAPLVENCLSWDLNEDAVGYLEDLIDELYQALLTLTA